MVEWKITQELSHVFTSVHASLMLLLMFYGPVEAPCRAFAVAYVSGLMFILVRWCVHRAGMCVCVCVWGMGDRARVKGEIDRDYLRSEF